jgi:hypothetical protein
VAPEVATSAVLELLRDKQDEKANRLACGAGKAVCGGAACDGARLAGRHWGRRRDGGYAGPGSAVTQSPRSTDCGRYAGLTGSPDESGSKRREGGLAKSGNARVRRGLIELAWRFLRFHKDSALAQLFQARTAGNKGARKTKMIAALARKLLIALWRLVKTGEVPAGVTLRQTA